MSRVRTPSPAFLPHPRRWGFSFPIPRQRQVLASVPAARRDGSREGAEADAGSVERPSDGWVAEGAHLALPLGSINGLAAISQAGMATQLGGSDRERIEKFHQRIHADAFGERLALAGLPVEFAAVVDARVFVPQRNVELGGYPAQDRSQRLVAVNVLVRV